MKTNSRIVSNSARIILALALGFAIAPAQAASTDIATAPLANASLSVVKPNMLFILDDSGSMGSEFMPDYVTGNYCKNNANANTTLDNCQAGDPAFASPDFNGVYYNPDIFYKPAVNSDGTSKTNYNTLALWAIVANDGYGVQFSGTSNLLLGYPDYVWCNTGSASVLDRTPPFASGKCKRELSGGTSTNGTLVGGTWTYPDGNFDTRESVVTGLLDPNRLNPYYYRFASITWCSTRDNLGFGNGTCQAKKTSTFQYPKYGAVTRTDIISGNSYPRTSNRSDCTGAVGLTGCTYTQEMTNFANWYAYYRTRMMMMKTSAGLAFKTIDDRYRVGFITINPTCQNYKGASDDGTCGSSVRAEKYLMIQPFDTTQRSNWYTKFYAQIPDPSTPLRTALSRAGRYFAHQTDQINNGITDDPIEYSCQQNFALLTTDGFWNGTGGKELDGTTDMGNYDANIVTTPRPLFDGSTLSTAVTDAPTRTQVVCTANGSIFAGGTTCGCPANFKRVKQQTVTNTTTVVSRDGVTQSTTPSSATTYQDITSCDATVITTTTPTTVVEDQVVQGGATSTFGAVNSVTAGSNQAGTCAANFARVKRRTTNFDKVVVTTDGTTTSNTNQNTTYTFTDLGSCVGLTNTVTTKYTIVEQEVLVGNTASTFTPVNGLAYTNAAGGCSTAGAGQAKVRTRTTTYNSTVVTTGASAGAPSITGTAYNTSDSACSNLTSTTLVPISETQQRVEAEGNPGTTDFISVFAGSPNPQSPYTCTGSGTRTMTMQRQMTYNRILTQVGNGAVTTSYSAPTGTPAYTAVTTCNTTAKTPAATATSVGSPGGATISGMPTAAPDNTSTAITVNTTTGQPAITLSPNPTTTTGTPVPSSVGTTITTANFTIPSGGPVTTSSTTTTSVIGYGNTLADVAQYYYMTDLRPAGSLGTAVSGVQLDVGTDNNVPGQTSTDPQKDTATHQHMTTFTLGLGLDGQLNFSQDYKETPTGDFLAIKNGTKNWPQPVGDTETAIDDLWHAAVNGRGKYFSAKNPALLSSGLSEALAGVNAVVGSAAAAATSNLEPVAGDNFAYIASYETVRWNGEIEARQINLNDGSIGDTAIWSAQGLLDTLSLSTSPGGNARNIKRFNAASANKLQDFTYANLTAAEQAYFNPPYISSGAPNPPALSQWNNFADPTNQQPMAQGANLVNFIRGDGAFEDQFSNSAVGSPPKDQRVFRDRQHVFGDVVNAQPVYVKQISVNYTDVGFATFKNCVNAGGSGCSTVFPGPRASTVYIAANDGMLHALNGDTGVERWAYVPSMVIPNLYRLADKDYGNRHLYYVDGSPTVGDVYDTTASKWKTILVGGLNSGGRGFYALDVTDPANPIGLWEFKARDLALCPGVTTLGVDVTDCDVGLSYGNPVISKLGNGKWVVMVTSGYNNIPTGAAPFAGDGKGYLYVLDPITGVILKKIRAANTTQFLSPGSSTTPAGLAKINNWVDDSDANNTTLRVYAGDLQGNVWRFDTDAGTAYSIAKLKDASNIAQPITTKPELGQANGKDMIYVATGEYLGTSDLPSTQVQTIYGIRDNTSGTVPASPINMRGTTVVAQTLANTTSDTGAAIRTVTANPVDLTVKDGFRVDLPTTGERVNVDPKLQLGTLIIGSNVPANTACSPGGFSFLNFLDYRTGSYIPSSSGSYAGLKVGNSLVVGISVVRLPNDKTVAIVTTSDNKHPTAEPPFNTENPSGRRSSWRELTQ